MQWYLKALREYADFDGRARRTEYWMFSLFTMLFAFVAITVDLMIMTVAQFPVPVLTIAYYLAMVVPSLAVSVRRLHDTDRSGAWILLNFVPFGGIALLVFFCTEGSPMPNRYGPSPKAIAPPSPPQPQWYGPTYA